MNNLVPMTIHEILAATESGGDSYLIEDKEPIGTCAVVGIVRKVDNKNTKIVYTVDDHTGARHHHVASHQPRRHDRRAAVD